MKKPLTIFLILLLFSSCKITAYYSVKPNGTIHITNIKVGGKHAAYK